MEAQDSMPSVTALRRWLYAVSILRFWSVYIGFCDYTQLRRGLFNNRPELVTDLYGRTFAVWTTVTCVLCLVCARDPKVPVVYGATLFSFVAAFFHFTTELLVFKTMTPWSALVPVTVAGISSLWMGLGWSYYTNYARTTPGSLEAADVEVKTD